MRSLRALPHSSDTRGAKLLTAAARPAIIIIRSASGSSRFVGYGIEATPIVEHRNTPGLPQMFAVRAEHINLAANEGTVIWKPSSILVVRRACKFMVRRCRVVRVETDHNRRKIEVFMGIVFD